MKKLQRSTKNKMLAGVCGGIGEYLNIDPTVVRLLFVVTTVWVGIGLIAYIFAWILMPLDATTSLDPIAENIEEIKSKAKEAGEKVKTEFEKMTKKDAEEATVVSEKESKDK